MFVRWICKLWLALTQGVQNFGETNLGHLEGAIQLCIANYLLYEAYSDSKYRFAVKKSSKVSYKILLLSDSAFFKLFFQIFAAIIEALTVAGHTFLYTLLVECGRLRC